MAPTVHILIPAAGASRRMGDRDKLTEDVGGKPLLRLVVETALATGAPVIVTLPVKAATRRDALAGLPIRHVVIPDANEGMSRSLVRGSQAVSGEPHGPDDGLMILPADMPDFTAAALRHMIAAFQSTPSRILRGCTASGTPGHPVIFPHALWAELQSLQGDKGAQALLQRHAGCVGLVPLSGDMAVIDLDTPEDWAAWRAR